jgi:hypothetical protein
MAEMVGGKVPMNMGVVQDSTNVSAEDSEDMREIRMIKAWVHQDMEARKEFDTHWESRRNAYKGKTWSSQKNQGGKSQPEINVIRVVLQTIIPILTDKRPGFNVIPKSPGAFQFSQMLSDGIENLWERQAMQNKIVETLMDSGIIDCGILKVYWDPSLEDGLGDICIEVKDPSLVWVNKEAEDFDRNCKRVTEKVYKTVGEWKRLFPDKANEIHGDSAGQKRDQKTGAVYDGTVTLVSPVDQDRGFPEGSQQAQGANDNALAEGWEIWYEDETVEEYDLQVGEGAEPKKGLRKKYPRGHLTTILPSQNVVLQSIEQPYELPSFNPYVRFISTLMPRSFYGEGDAEPLMDLQKLLNKTVQSVTEYLRLMSNPVWVMDKESGVNPENLTNKVGMIIRKLMGTEVKREVAPPINNAVFQFIQILQGFIDQVSGIHDVTQGRKPAGITAAQAIETLEDAAQTRIRLKERNLETSLSKLGRIIIPIMLQNYKQARWVTIAGDNPDIPNYMNFFIEDLGQRGYQINQQHYLWNVETQQYEMQAPVMASAPKSIFDVKVVAGTALPQQKAQRANLGLKLLEAGVIDQEEILTTLEWPNKENVIQRMTAAAQQQAAVQQQASADEAANQQQLEAQKQAAKVA